MIFIGSRRDPSVLIGSSAVTMAMLLESIIEIEFACFIGIQRPD